MIAGREFHSLGHTPQRSDRKCCFLQGELQDFSQTLIEGIVQGCIY